MFTELFVLLTGNENYDKIYNSNMINYVVDNIKFLPLNFTKISAFFDKLTLITYISTMKKMIFCNVSNIDKKILDALENAIIIEIEFHEFGHFFSAVLSYIKNNEFEMDTPRKKNLKTNEGGYYVEMALFGRIIKTLTYEEALYILNMNNNNKSLEEFRAGFQSPKEEDFKIIGPFENLNLDVDNRKKYKNKISINAKAKDENLSNIKINIPLKNDVKGRNFTEEDVLLYC